MAKKPTKLELQQRLSELKEKHDALRIEHSKYVSIPPHVAIGILRDAFPTSASVFTTGACFELFKLLKQFYPYAEPWADAGWGHVWTKIGSNFYDIYGVRPEGAEGLVCMYDEPKRLQAANNWKFKRGHYSDGDYL